MPVLLRQLRIKNCWRTDEPLPWLGTGEVPADPLANFKTGNNTLSVFVVEGDRRRIERIAAAMAATATHLDDFEYVVFDQNVLQPVGIQIIKVEGDTVDSIVNDWHMDLVELSAAKVAELARILVPNCEPDMVTAKRVVEVLADIIASGSVSRQVVAEHWRRDDKRLLKQEIEQRTRVSDK